MEMDRKRSCKEYEEKVQVCISEIVKLTQRHKKQHTKEPNFHEREYLVIQTRKIVQLLFEGMGIYNGEIVYIAEFLKLRNLLKSSSPVPPFVITSLPSRRMKPGTKIRKAPDALYG